MDITKTTLLKMADGFFAEARRIRKECSTQASGPERDQLIGEAEQLEAKAARLEREAASAKDGAIGPSQLSPRSGGRAFDR